MNNVTIKIVDQVRIMQICTYLVLKGIQFSFSMSKYARITLTRPDFDEHSQELFAEIKGYELEK